MFDVNKLQVAKPCHVGWETMSGDERSRQCAQCQLNVYNIAGMTAPEAQHLIETREGRVCIRLVRRTDGTVLTKDCPVGIRKYRAHAARYAGAALATILGVFSVSYGQKNDKAIDASKIKITRTKIISEKAEIGGYVTDPNGAVVPGMRLTLISSSKKRIYALSDGEGRFVFSDIVPAKGYRIEISREFSGFKQHRIKNIDVNPNETLEFNIVLEPKNESVVVGLYGEPSLIDTRSSTVETVITADKLRRIP